ncbi:hypothetical protein B7C51_04330 [Paenibacillus larvae subsp. pulvifaciens]|uniref:Uncharacterized protein n=1 Tax=Paenibacillus larvae subsp. pulvifaciens TaxID=1477 RepID=A0A1V0UPV3_9BACL|nr:hypothetical protein [Paenibacillus larvae]ARF67204.1 hypothetical protein B7C51_04330 [Paenibacillus larvae subsp. pulvifaciens]
MEKIIRLWKWYNPDRVDGWDPGEGYSIKKPDVKGVKFEEPQDYVLPDGYQIIEFDGCLEVFDSSGKHCSIVQLKDGPALISRHEYAELKRSA